MLIFPLFLHIHTVAYPGFQDSLLFRYIMLNKKEPNSVHNPLFGSNTELFIVVNSSLSGEFFGYFAELIGRQLELFAVEIDVIFALHGDQMDVCMGNFEP